MVTVTPTIDWFAVGGGESGGLRGGGGFGGGWTDDRNAAISATHTHFSCTAQTSGTKDGHKNRNTFSLAGVWHMKGSQGRIT